MQLSERELEVLNKDTSVITSYAIHDVLNMYKRGIDTPEDYDPRMH